MKHIFFDNYGNFQWACVAALISLIVGGISIYNNRKTLKLQKELNNQNFKGNIVSAARIEWIQEVRKISVDFISTCYDLIRNTQFNEDESKILELKSSIEKSATLLILYFGPDEDNNKNNDFIVYLINLLTIKLTNREDYYPKEHVLKLDEELEVLRDFLRIYFKAEWKRANRKISDAEIQDYLEKHEVYRKIIKIYEKGFEEEQEHVECFYNRLDKRYNRN